MIVNQMVEPCCNTYATVVRVHPIVYSTGQMMAMTRH
nr:MAG TPA: hypothetical protein [Caudoviricetes sp.]